MNRATNAYRQTQVTTTSQGEVLLMLYDGAISFLSQAKERIDAKDPAGKGNLISKTLDIINELDSTLNLERGGSLSENLHNLYFFCNKHLLLANLRMNKDMIDEVIKILVGLRSAYAAIQDLPEAKAAGLEAAASQHAKSTSTNRPSNVGTGTNSQTSPNRGLSMYAQNTGSTVNIAQNIVAGRLQSNIPNEHIDNQISAQKNLTPIEQKHNPEPNLQAKGEENSTTELAQSNLTTVPLHKTNLYKKFASGNL